jgi:CheY-like chemotaxis protein
VPAQKPKANKAAPEKIPAPPQSAVAAKKVAPEKPNSPKPIAKTSAPMKKEPMPPTKPLDKPVVKPQPQAMPAKSPAIKSPSKPKVKSSLDDLPLDLEEKEDLAEEEKQDLVSALEIDDDTPMETTFVPTDTSERYILVVDEEGQRRGETTDIISQILPNAVVEVADDPEEALEMMQDCEFDTYVVNFLMPGYSASPFVKAVANHPDHPLLIGFAADKISDAVDPKKGLKIIPLKRLFDLDVGANAEGGEEEAEK